MTGHNIDKITSAYSELTTWTGITNYPSVFYRHDLDEHFVIYKNDLWSLRTFLSCVFSMKFGLRITPSIRKQLYLNDVRCKIVPDDYTQLRKESDTIVADFFDGYVKSNTVWNLNESISLYITDCMNRISSSLSDWVYKTSNEDILRFLDTSNCQYEFKGAHSHRGKPVATRYTYIYDHKNQ